MGMAEAFLQALHDNPVDETAWLALGDWLEDHGDPRAELVRLHRRLLATPFGPGRRVLQVQVQALLASGVRPCVPVLTRNCRPCPGSGRWGGNIVCRRRPSGNTP